MDYDFYDQQIHQLFEAALTIRSNPSSTIDQLHAADKVIDEAVELCDIMQTTISDNDIKNEIINNRLRCYIEQLAIHTRLLRLAYNTPQFEVVSQQHQQRCHRYLTIKLPNTTDTIEQSIHQLTVMAYQSLSANYFRCGGMGTNKTLCEQAITYIDKAIELANDDDNRTVLQNNKAQIIVAINKAQHE